jgi:hypothetical protein
MRLFQFLGLWILFLAVAETACVKRNKDERNKVTEASSNSEVESGMTPDQLAAMHSGLKSCNSCHTKDRPAPPHDQQADCVGCHSFPSFKGSLSASLHDPKPASCNSCHEKDRPAAPHVAQQDCVGCHSFPKFNTVVSSFNHSPTPESCNSCHESKRPAAPHIANKDCVGCHAFPSFQRLAFSHVPKPAVCEECHTRPTTVGLRAYPNQGPPAGFVANDPKALGGRHYVGKDCSSCHRTPDEGAAAFNFTHSTPRADFCLPCHYNDGQEEHLNDNRAVMTEFGNCAGCHRNFDVNVMRNWGRGNGNGNDD